MRKPPQVTVRDPRRSAAPLGQYDEEGRADEQGDDGQMLSRSRRTVVGALLIGCAAGFAAAYAFDVGARPADSPPQLAVVTGRDATVPQGDGAQPRGAVEVTLVNTGTGTLRVLGGDIRGSGLSWSADQPLEPGAQLTAVLADPFPCTSATEGFASSKATLDVDVVENGGRRQLALSLRPTFLRDYDADVRRMCGMLAVSEALWVVLFGGPGDAGPDLAVPVVLLNRTVEPVQLLSVSSAVVGTSAVLRTRTGADVPMPLTLPGRSLAQLRQDALSVEPEASPYVLAVTVEHGACAELRARGGETVTVGLHYAYDNEPLNTADTFVALDLEDLVGRACA